MIVVLRVVQTVQELFVFGAFVVGALGDLARLQKRESLSASADQVLVTVEEVQAELQKTNLPRRLDQPTLEKLLRTLRRYNLARPVGRLSGLDSRIEVFPTVLLALPDADLADAAAESARTRTELGLYERPEGADTEAGEAEAQPRWAGRCSISASCSPNWNGKASRCVCRTLFIPGVPRATI